MKTVIIYFSRHHENTKEVLDAIAAKHGVTLLDATKTKYFDLTEYDLIGLASGIYYSKFHKSVLEFAEENLPMDKRVFFLYTYGVKKEGYTRAIEAVTSQKGAEVVGAFSCLGFNTFGPFKLIGGIAKGHPDRDECNDAVRFYETLIKTR